jgi:hypothetical protein
MTLDRLVLRMVIGQDPPLLLLLFFVLISKPHSRIRGVYNLVQFGLG